MRWRISKPPFPGPGVDECHGSVMGDGRWAGVTRRGHTCAGRLGTSHRRGGGVHRKGGPCRASAALSHIGPGPCSRFPSRGLSASVTRALEENAWPGRASTCHLLTLASLDVHRDMCTV